jgi:FkbM family methyltransferase
VSVSQILDSVRVLRFTWEHPANARSRARALTRAIRFQVSGRLLHRRTIARLGDHSRIWADLHRTGASKVVYANPPDYPEMVAWKRVLRPGELFVDVGSNVGSYAIWAAELGAEVVALEPAPDTFGLLAENVSLNGYPIRIVQAAAGAKCGSVRFTAGLDSVNRMDEQGSTEVTMVTIDSIVGERTIAGMKIDVEGFEMDVLLGCERALSEGRIKLIQLEWNEASRLAAQADRQPVADLLTKHGYRLYRPDGRGELMPLHEVSFGSDVFARPWCRYGE